MRRATHALWVLYAALAVGLLGAALLSHQAGHWPGTVFFAAAAIGAAMAVVHTSWLLDEHHNVLVDLDRATRPIKTAQDQQVAELLAPCCEVWWATAGHQHDPAHCTRKDTTT
ncbi:hypothetical protein ACW4TU_30330 [Streptomyces sp. QTS52]